MKAYIVEKNAVLHNIDYLLNKADTTPVWAVLKGNGYGLGLAPMAELCWQKGIRRFAVTETDEAALVQALLAEYEVDEETAKAAVATFVAKLNENGFLV